MVCLTFVSLYFRMIEIDFKIHFHGSVIFVCRCIKKVQISPAFVMWPSR